MYSLWDSRADVRVGLAVPAGSVNSDRAVDGTERRPVVSAVLLLVWLWPHNQAS